MSTSRELTMIDQGWLEHLRRAHAQGVTLVEYARTAGVKVGSLYETRRTLLRKGVRVPGTTVAVPAAKPAQFVAVRVARPAVAAAGMPCRLRHPSGWVIECAEWPQTGWIKELLGERP